MHRLYNLTAWRTFKEDPINGHVGVVDRVDDVKSILQEYEKVTISQYCMKTKYGNIPVENLKEIGW